MLVIANRGLVSLGAGDVLWWLVVAWDDRGWWDGGSILDDGSKSSQ